MLDVDVVPSAEISPVTDPDANALASAILFAPPVLHAIKLRYSRNSTAGYCGGVVYDITSSIAFTTS